MEWTQVWFVVLATMLTVYAILDGFDLGVGALHLFVARTDAERETSINAIGPVWNGNEVWLLAAGGSMVVAYPHLYASGFSGFYLALMLVLWLLVLRGIGIEFRHQVRTTIWREAWDVVFCGASILLAVLFGVAAGNVLVGVPFDTEGRFTGSFAVLLNWFAILGGVLSLGVLLLHGANYLAMKTEGAIQQRSRAVGKMMFCGGDPAAGGRDGRKLRHPPGAGRGPAGLPGQLHGLPRPVRFHPAERGFHRGDVDGPSGTGTTAWPSSPARGSSSASSPRSARACSRTCSPRTRPTPGLTIYNAKSADSSQRIAFFIYLFGITIVAAYMVYVYRIWGGKVDEHGGYHA